MVMTAGTGSCSGGASSSGDVVVADPPDRPRDNDGTRSATAVGQGSAIDPGDVRPAAHSSDDERNTSGGDDQPPPGTESADNRDVTAADSSALDEQLEAAGVPGLATRFVLSRESPHLGDALRGTIDFEVEDRDGVQLPSQRALWRPALAVLARFESPPSSALETNRWYQLGPPRGVDRGMPLPPARKSPYGSRVLVLVPLVYVRVLTPGREDENHTIWSGRLTEATGRVDLKVASLDEHGDVSLTYAATTFLVPTPDESEAAALAWLRSRRVVGALGTTAFDSGGPTLRATMSEFLELFPDSRFRDEARYSLAVALEREGEDSDALAVLRGLSTEADDLALRAWAAVMAAQVHRGNGNKPGVLQVLAVTPDPGENAVLADQVRSLRRWASR